VTNVNAYNGFLSISEYPSVSQCLLRVHVVLRLAHVPELASLIDQQTDRQETMHMVGCVCVGGSYKELDGA